MFYMSTRRIESLDSLEGEIIMQEHMVICKEPYLSLILQGKKKIESRWSQQNRTPFKKVKVDDHIYLKKSGGLVLGEADIYRASYYHDPLTKQMIDILVAPEYRLYIQDDFKPKCYQAKYVSLFWLENVIVYKPSERFGWRHIGQDAWIPLKPGWKKDCIGLVK